VRGRPIRAEDELVYFWSSTPPPWLVPEISGAEFLTFLPDAMRPGKVKPNGAWKSRAQKRTRVPTDELTKSKRRKDGFDGTVPVNQSKLLDS
jgi:hypothetical protein